jgi:hypothetical protein
MNIASFYVFLIDDRRRILNIRLALAHMKKQIIALVTLLSIISFAARGTAQERLSPRTQLEMFQRRVGVVLVKRTIAIGGVDGFKGAISVRTVEYSDMSNGQRAQGVEFHIIAGDGSYPEIDYDEIDSFLKALEQMAVLDKSATELEKDEKARLEANFITRGNMTMSFIRALPYIPDRGRYCVVIDPHTPGGQTVSVSIAKLNDLKRIVTEAKVKLDSQKAATK